MARMVGEILLVKPSELCAIGYDNAGNHALIDSALLGIACQSLDGIPFFEELSFISWTRWIPKWPYMQPVFKGKPFWGGNDWAHTAKNVVGQLRSSTRSITIGDLTVDVSCLIPNMPGYIVMGKDAQSDKEAAAFMSPALMSNLPWEGYGFVVFNLVETLIEGVYWNVPYTPQDFAR